MWDNLRLNLRNREEARMTIVPRGLSLNTRIMFFNKPMTQRAQKENTSTIRRKIPELQDQIVSLQHTNFTKAWKWKSLEMCFVYWKFTISAKQSNQITITKQMATNDCLNNKKTMFQKDWEEQVFWWVPTPPPSTSIPATLLSLSFLSDE